SRAFTTNPARSAQTTGVLPTLLLTARAMATVSGAVRMVRTTSTSGITGAGLKKCIPTTFAGRDVAMAHSMTGKLDVVVAKTTDGLQISSSEAKSAFLTLSSSTTASTTRSTSERVSREAAQLTRSSAASRSASDSLPRTTPLFREVRTVSRSACAFSVPRDTEVTAYPALAKTSTMPAAMTPDPTTPTERTGCAGSRSSAGSGVSSSATTIGEPGAWYV